MEDRACLDIESELNSLHFKQILILLLLRAAQVRYHFRPQQWQGASASSAKLWPSCDRSSKFAPPSDPSGFIEQGKRSGVALPFDAYAQLRFRLLTGRSRCASNFCSQ